MKKIILAIITIAVIAFATDYYGEAYRRTQIYSKISIDYSKRSIDINYRENVLMCYGKEALCEEESLDISPEDVESTDTVETVWALK